MRHRGLFLVCVMATACMSVTKAPIPARSFKLHLVSTRTAPLEVVVPWSGTATPVAADGHVEVSLPRSGLQCRSYFLGIPIESAPPKPFLEVRCEGKVLKRLNTLELAAMAVDGDGYIALRIK